MSRAVLERDDLHCFFRELSAAKSRALVLDYDGTLAPFSQNRYNAAPYPGVPDLLRRIMKSGATRLVVVSGRAAHEVPPLLGLRPAPEIFGTNGVQRIRQNGFYEELPVNEDALRVLAQAETQLEDAGLGRYLEVKLAAVALHWRGLSSAETLRIRTKAYRILEPLARQPELVLAEFEEGVEIRLTSANKGIAIRTLLSEFGEGVPVAYLGDDASDEEAFRTLNGRGLSVLVRPRPRFSAAKVWLKPPDELVWFLTEWISACGGRR